MPGGGGARLQLIPRRWSLWGLSLSKALLPGVGSYKHETDGRFQIDVEIAVPVIGWIVHYKAGCGRTFARMIPGFDG
ncbi:DUF4166 domain-containing protein [Pseudogemmobacter hezensis]|uniref:DUF4166 domain-containing protein n=1 Tax=Pseudogemmobacter hezensis TaxID=2737662 RepID=UPI00345B0760